MTDVQELKKAVKTRQAMVEYQDTIYLGLIRQLNNDVNDVLKGDLGSEFVRNCGRDLAGEVVRNCFDTSDYYLTVDQLAERILHFTYEKEYDPLAQNGRNRQIVKNVLNYNELSSAEIEHILDVMDESQEQLFNEDRKQDKLDREGKKAYRESQKDENGDVYDELTGKKGDKTTYINQKGTEVEKSTLQADHVQARESAKVNNRYVSDEGKDALKEFWNSSDNMQMMFQSANTSKSDVRVCDVNGKIVYRNARSNDYDPATDITHRATPEQLADAAIAMWENININREQRSEPKIQNLKEKGYLDENGKVPKAVRMQLIKNIRHSQNVESTVILKNTKCDQVAKDSANNLKASMGKIIAGQVIYYTAPPLVYELRTILSDTTITIENALEKIKDAGKRICEYVISKLKDIFTNIAFDSLKKFIKSFMDILINLVKATVKKILKMAKRLVLSTVDAVRIIADKNSTPSEKADSVVNLFAVTVTSCVIEVMFEILGETLHIPEPFDDILLGPLQILATVMCTNLTMLILKKADLFDVRQGFKMTQIRQLFKDTNDQFNQIYDTSSEYTDEVINNMIERAKEECKVIYENLEEINYREQSARDSLEKINNMFSMNINFEEDWLRFIGKA